MTNDLLQKNYWTREDRLDYVFGSRTARLRAEADANINRLEKQIAKIDACETDGIYNTREQLAANLLEWIEYRSKLGAE